MAIIEAKGLFLGDRISKCSDEAQLHWPRLYAAANNFARLELNYRHVKAAAYSGFKNPITEKQFWALIKEYRANFLLFVYEHEGVIWGQFQTNERYLARHKTAADRRSPAPPVEAQEEYRKQYLLSKQKNQGLADLLQVTPTCADLLQVTPRGVGVGVGVGGGIGEKQNTSRDKREAHPLFSDVKELVFRYYRSKNDGQEPEWGPGEGKQLSELLKANPNAPLEHWTRCLMNRHKSIVAHGDRPMLWITRLSSFSNGPLDQYGKPQGAGNGTFKGKSGHSVDAATRAIQAFEDRAAADRSRDSETGEAGHGGLHSLRDGSGEIRTSGLGNGDEPVVLEASR